MNDDDVSAARADTGTHNTFCFCSRNHYPVLSSALDEGAEHQVVCLAVCETTEAE